MSCAMSIGPGLGTNGGIRIGRPLTPPMTPSTTTPPLPRRLPPPPSYAVTNPNSGIASAPVPSLGQQYQQLSSSSFMYSPLLGKERTISSRGSISVMTPTYPMSSPTYNVPLAGGRPSLRVPSPFSYNVNPLVSARKAPRSLSYTVPTCVQTAATSPGSVVLPPKEMPVQLASRPGSLAVPGPITPIQAKAVRPQGPPEKLTGGIPHPTSVEHQKDPLQ